MDQKGKPTDLLDSVVRIDAVNKLERLPERGRRVIVISATHCRCLGYLDTQSIWRDDAYDHEIRDVIGWQEP